MTAAVTNAYHDECGCFRLAGLVTNQGAQALIAPLVAAVYDAQGGLLLVQVFSTTLPAAPGAPLPFGVSFGASVSSGISPERAKVQVDLAGVVAPAETVALPAAVLDMIQTQWKLSFNSEITNTSSQTLTSIDVIAAAYDKKGRLVAAEPINVSPADGGALATGAAFPLNATLLLDGAVAPNSLKLVLLPRGRLRQRQLLIDLPTSRMID